jgi:hypothetical protein
MNVEWLLALRTGRIYPQEIFLVLLSVKRLSRPQGHSAAGRIMSVKNYSDTIGNRSRDLPVCSAVPQPPRHRVPPESIKVHEKIRMPYRIPFGSQSTAVYTKCYTIYKIELYVLYNLYCISLCVYCSTLWTERDSLRHAYFFTYVSLLLIPISLLSWWWPHSWIETSCAV